MLSVEEAQARVLAQFRALPGEDVALPHALGRILAEDSVAREPLPAFANSAMDGYALRAADTQAASPEHPIALTLAGEIPAGRVYEGTVGEGQAVRILTGAPVPESADAVIQQELVEVVDGVVHLSAPVVVGNNVRPAGDDVLPGQLLAPKGTELGPAELALLAALGVHPVRVTRRPRVAILGTGDELVPLGQTPRPGQIRDSNTVYLAAAVTRAGGDPQVLGIAGDRADELRARLREAQAADLILTSGGVSVGDYDLVKQMLAEQGDIDFWRVRMRPGKPLAFGLLGKTPLLGLPGNPVSAAVTFELFARPAIRTQLGAAQIERPRIEARLAGQALERADRRQYVRAQLSTAGGQLVAQPTGNQGSHILSSLRGASCFLIVETGEGVIAPGELVPALLLNDAMPWDAA